MYNAKLGYNRAELALVPSNRASGKEGDVSTGNGAADTTDVMMELHYGSIFSLSSSSIYQRLAVGKNAVSQPGASLMFAKGKNGELDPEVAKALSKTVQILPEVPTEITPLKTPLSEAYLQRRATEQIKFDKAAQAAGFRSFDAFLADPATTPAQIEQVKKGLQ
jgi:hypothetical protein